MNCEVRGDTQSCKCCNYLETYQSFRLSSFCLQTVVKNVQKAWLELCVGVGLQCSTLHHFFFFLAVRHFGITCEVWHMLHLLSTIRARLQSGAKNSRRMILGAGGSPWFSMIRDLDGAQNHPSSTIHPVVCLSVIFRLCLNSHTLVLLSAPSLVVSLCAPSCQLSPGTNEWLIRCCKN